MSEIPFKVNKLAIKNIEFHTGNIDPSVTGFTAPLRSVYFSDSEDKWWRKTGVNDLNWTLQGTGSGLTGESVIITVNQTSHGFTVGNILRKNGSGYVKAKADSVVNSNVSGIVNEIIDINTFKLCLSGYINTLSGLTNVSQYYLSDSTEGAYSVSSSGIYQKPVFTALSSTECIVNIGTTSFGSLINNNEYLLSNNGILTLSSLGGKWEFALKSNSSVFGNFLYKAGDTDLVINLGNTFTELFITDVKDTAGYINIYIETGNINIQNILGGSVTLFIKKIF